MSVDPRPSASSERGPPVPEGGSLQAAMAELVARTGFRPVRRVQVAVGPGIDRREAEAAWTHAAAGTVVERAAVTWVEARDTLRCLDCGALYLGGRRDHCPGCGGDGLVVEPAPEFALEKWS